MHFSNNLGSNANESVGIEIEIIKRNNITIIESNSNVRFKVKSYDEGTNFCVAEEYEDDLLHPSAKSGNEIDSKHKDLLMSEIYELKNLWFVYNKKINSYLVILPNEVLNRYEMVAKTL